MLPGECGQLQMLHSALSSGRHAPWLPNYMTPATLASCALIRYVPVCHTKADTLRAPPKFAKS